MRWTLMLLSTCVLLLAATPGMGQQRQNRQQGRQDPRSGMNARFLEADPKIGEPIPDVSLFTAEGDEFNLAAVKGSYTVLVFGCLT